MPTGLDSWRKLMDRIHEIIVVEGRHDTQQLKKYFDCETIETGGSSIDDKVIEQIRYASSTRGVIVFTDPDTPGNQIRHIINQHVPNCKNAFVEKRNARTEKKVGIEHADKDTLWNALQNVVTITNEPKGNLTMSDLFELGLSGQSDSTELRRKVGEYYHIGDGNAKTMLARLNCIAVCKEELREVIDK